MTAHPDYRFGKITPGKSTLGKITLGAFALLILSGCYYYPYRYGYGPYDRGYGPYDRGYYDNDAWYDGYYGPYYGGYWGQQGNFYYYDRDRRAHPDEERHFRHDRFEGAREYHSDRYENRGGYDRDDRDRDDDR